jgi:broad specificity phosphatase PhoE
MIDNVQHDIHLHLVPVRGLADEILVHKITGQLYMNGAAVRLKFPMLVVRHGETDGNLRSTLSGQVDGPENQLNAKGKQQAQQSASLVFADLEQRLGSVRLLELAQSGRLMILSSPITRAKHTAEAFVHCFHEKTSIGLDVILEEDLKEISLGKYDGCALEEIDDEDFAALVKRYRGTQDATIDWLGTGESFLAVAIRAKQLLDRLNQTHAGKLVIAFSHGTFTSALRTTLGDRTLINEDGIVAFRDRIIGHAVPHWLNDSL